MNEMKYGELITKIRKKRSWVLVLTIAAVLLLLIFGSPIYIKAFGRVIVDYPGFPIALTVLLILLCLFVEIMVLAVVSAPIQASLDQECDPEKHFILNTVEYVQESYTSGCMHERNRRLVDSAELCVAYCEHSGGGTAYTVAYALKNEKELINIADLI